MIYHVRRDGQVDLRNRDMEVGSDGVEGRIVDVSGEGREGGCQSSRQDDEALLGSRKSRIRRFRRGKKGGSFCGGWLRHGRCLNDVEAIQIQHGVGWPFPSRMHAYEELVKVTGLRQTSHPMQRIICRALFLMPHAQRIYNRGRAFSPVSPV